MIFELFLECEAFGKWPSEALGLREPLAIGQFNRAVAMFGLYVRGKLNERDDKGKQKYKLADILRTRAAAPAMQEMDAEQFLARFQGIGGVEII